MTCGSTINEAVATTVSWYPALKIHRGVIIAIINAAKHKALRLEYRRPVYRARMISVNINTARTTDGDKPVIIAYTHNKMTIPIDLSLL